MTISAAKSPARRVGGWLALVVAIISFLPSVAGAAGAAAAGNVTFSETSGGSRAVFSVRPPDGAKCPGDTADDFYLVNSYLVPEGTAPTAVKFLNGVPSRGYGLIDEGAFYGAVNTQRNTGALFIFPDHANWTRLTPKDVFPNGETTTVWETGISCSDRNGDVQRYWNTEVTFTASAKDPGGFTWSVAQSGSSKSSRTTGIIAVLAIAVALAAITVAVIARRRSRQSVSRGR